MPVHHSGRRDGLHFHLLVLHLGGGGAPLVPGLREERDLLQSREVDDGLDTTADVNEGVPHRLHQAAERVRRVVVLEGDIRTLNSRATNITGFYLCSSGNITEDSATVGLQRSGDFPNIHRFFQKSLLRVFWLSC